MNIHQHLGHAHNGRKQEGIRLAVINTASIKVWRKAGEFKAYIANENPYIIVACETNLTANEVDSDFLPDGYSAFRHDKCSTKHGVLIAYKQNLIMSKIEVIEKTCELVLAKLQVLGRPDLNVGSFYCHTNSDPASIRALSENLLAIMGKEWTKNFVLAGTLIFRV